MVRRKTLPPRNILVVEDDGFFVNVFKYALEKRSFNVIAENSYEDALEVMEKTPVSLVLADIFVPGMGGIEGIRRIRTRFPSVYVIATSGGYKDVTAENATRAAKKIGANVVLQKPIPVSDFENALKSFIDNERPSFLGPR